MQRHDQKNTKKLSSLCVLAFEEDKANRYLLEKVLTKNGYVADVVEKASEVLDRLTKHNEKYDLLIINICSPLKDELDLVKIIRSLPEKHVSSIPVLATTTAIHSDIKHRCQAVGIVDVIMKPFNIEELSYMIRQSIRCTKRKNAN